MELLALSFLSVCYFLSGKSNTYFIVLLMFAVPAIVATMGFDGTYLAVSIVAASLLVIYGDKHLILQIPLCFGLRFLHYKKEMSPSG